MYIKLYWLIYVLPDQIESYSRVNALSYKARKVITLELENESFLEDLVNLGFVNPRKDLRVVI